MRHIEDITIEELNTAYETMEDFRDYVNGIVRNLHKDPKELFDNYMVKEYYLYLLHKNQV